MTEHNVAKTDGHVVRVRKAVLSDANEISRLLTQLGHPTSADEVRTRWPDWDSHGNSALVAESDATSLVGLCTLHRTHVLHRAKPVGRVTALVVDENVRSGGVGAKLMEAAELELKNAGCGLLEVTSNVSRVRAHAFYEKLGYDKTSVRLARDLWKKPPTGS